jgi:hypothetical protein
MVGDPKDLSDLRRVEATLRVTCRRCGHAREFDIGELGRELSRRRKSSAWDALPHHFRCGCGARRPRLLPIPFGARRSDELGQPTMGEQLHGGGPGDTEPIGGRVDRG